MKPIAIAAVTVLLLCGQHSLAAETGSKPQTRMGQCSTQAKERGLKGDARKEYMSQCLRNPATRAAAKECSSAAAEKGLKGEARRSFVNDCIRSKEGAAAVG